MVSVFPGSKAKTFDFVMQQINSYHISPKFLEIEPFTDLNFGLTVEKDSQRVQAGNLEESKLCRPPGSGSTLLVQVFLSENLF